MKGKRGWEGGGVSRVREVLFPFPKIASVSLPLFAVSSHEIPQILSLLAAASVVTTFLPSERFNNDTPAIGWLRAHAATRHPTQRRQNGQRPRWLHGRVGDRRAREMELRFFFF